MFCIIYEFEVVHDNEYEFQQIWHDLTLLIKETGGGLGSRLHKDICRNNYWIAYAQWPSKEAWHLAFSSTYNEYIAALRNRMTAACKNIRTVYQLENIDDLLVLEN